MRRLTQAPNIVLATLWADALQQAGIAASVQRQYLGSVAGELPPDQCLPEIWLLRDEQLVAARQLLKELQHLPQFSWTCACGEAIEGAFAQCWRCGALMPG